MAQFLNIPVNKLLTMTLESPLLPLVNKILRYTPNLFTLPSEKCPWSAQTCTHISAHLYNFFCKKNKRRTDCCTKTAAWRYSAASNNQNLYSLRSMRFLVCVIKFMDIVKKTVLLINEVRVYTDKKRIMQHKN